MFCILLRSHAGGFLRIFYFISEARLVIMFAVLLLVIIVSLKNLC
ncbi:hypothetical protein TREPR_2118 [Treponema primitia ZAS-2]|uniref:Uncharacterized protein n=1 Tax=Treponema primitia (strain ATCC BAA-887 / DSM 12427 / ZAS-2) TaxID=545694 RepID=F5YJ76_TREPZ|nr:hypothetical protein TREPR_2118 [Treponema primitia ZAS-2]